MSTIHSCILALSMLVTPVCRTANAAPTPVWYASPAAPVGDEKLGDNDRCRIDIHPVQPPPALNALVLLSRSSGNSMLVHMFNLSADSKTIQNLKKEPIGTLEGNSFATIEFTARSSDNAKLEIEATHLKNFDLLKPPTASCFGIFDREVQARDLVTIGDTDTTKTLSFGIRGLESGFFVEQTAKCPIAVHSIQAPIGGYNNVMLFSLVNGDELTLYIATVGPKKKSLHNTDSNLIGQIVNEKLAKLTFLAKTGNTLTLTAAEGLRSTMGVGMVYPSIGLYDVNAPPQNPVNLLGPKGVAVLSFGIRGLQSFFSIKTVDS